MNYLDKMRLEKDSKPVILDKFLKLYPKCTNSWFCFYEGFMDNSYYKLRIERYIPPDKIEYLCAKGKDNVVYMEKLLNNHKDYKKCKYLFLVDRDFDRKLNNPNIFETPCYSIENLFTQKECLEQLLKIKFDITQENPNYNTILNLYDKLFNEFHEVITELNAWIFYQRRMERKNKEKRKLKLDLLFSLNKHLYKLKWNPDTKFEDIKIEKKYDLAFLKQHFPSSYETDKSFCKYMKIAKIVAPGKRYRGKQEFIFFCMFIEKIKEFINISRQSNKDLGVIKNDNSTMKVDLDLSSKKEDQMEKLINYAITPPELEIYVQKQIENTTINRRRI